MSQVQIHQDRFTSQGVANLLWALATLGDGGSLNAALNILRTIDIDTIESSQEKKMTLWALTIFLASGGETSLLLPPMKRLYDALMIQKENSSDSSATIMRLAGIWLGENLQGLPSPNYKTTFSKPHLKLHGILKASFSHHVLEMEASVNGLPPVDLLFPDKKVVVEVQGAHHYIDKEKKLRNGRTILKIMTYRRLGYKVFEIPASDVDNKESQVKLERELSAFFSNKGNSANSSTEPDYKTAEEDGCFPAEEKKP